jgi:hypothetical protein
MRFFYKKIRENFPTRNIRNPLIPIANIFREMGVIVRDDIRWYSPLLQQLPNPLQPRGGQHWGRLSLRGTVVAAGILTGILVFPGTWFALWGTAGTVVFS